MRMSAFSGAITLAPWYRIPFLLLALAGVGMAVEPPALRLGRGIAAYNLKDYASAISHLRGLRTQVPALADYATYYLASSEIQTGAVDDAVAELAAYKTKPVASSLFAGKLTLLYSRALLDQKRAASDAKALALLRSDPETLPEPDATFTRARAAEATGDLVLAAKSYQSVWYSWPESDLAEQSATAIERLRAALGAQFPDANAATRLARAEKLLDSRAYNKARTEFAALAESLPAPFADHAAASVGAAQYLGGDSVGAVRYLKALAPSDPEAEARRLYYLTEAAARSDDWISIAAATTELNQHHPQSPWRLKALLTAGNFHAKTGDRDKYVPLFRAAFDAFPEDGRVCPAHWRLAWDSWLADQPDRGDLLRQHVEKCTGDTRAGTALYFLGRLAQQERRFGDARAYYESLSQHYPHYFYGTLARERMEDAGVLSAKPTAAAKAWLETIAWPERRNLLALAPNPATKFRVERGRLLMTAGLADLADAELRFGAKTGNEQTAILALELARSLPSPFHAMRVMKSFSSDYLAIPFEQAPRSFWTTLFPLPYKDDVIKHSTARGLDPYAVAALIRQETEFNPAARSPVNALGLMQLMPPTGRELARKEGVKLASTNSLLDPAISIRLGTRYVHDQLQGWDGDWVRTLAAYNAGPGRLRQWLNTIPYREPAEFVESIPIEQTREYVQAVLRNADVYRAIYRDNRLKQGDVKEAYDVPPVRLTNLPLAARTPGGGVKSKTASVPGPRPGVRTVSRAKPTVVKKPAAQSATKKAPAKAPTPKKKLETAG